jgi:GYF domain 2
MTTTTLLTMVLWTLIGIATSYIANRKGRDPYIWFALGAFFGILAMLALVLLPPVKSEKELEQDERNKEIVERREKQMEEQEKIENAPNLEPQSIETKEWFYLDNERKQQGPLSFYVINELWEGGSLTPQTYVWTEGMPEWKRVQEIPDLRDILERLDAENRKSFPEDM